MKKLAMLVPVLAAAFLFNALPSFADEYAATGNMERVEAQKDQCLLVASLCPDNVDSMQQRISRLQKEISKGNVVYTDEELRKLNDKLADEIENFRHLTESN